MREFFDKLINGITKAINADPDGYNSRKKYVLEVARLGRELYSGEKPVAWCGITAPFDLLRAMNVTSCFVEFIGGMLASSGIIESFLEQSEQAGYASDICGYHRAVIGAVEKGIMPRPDFLIASTCPCSGGTAVIENLARIFNKDLFVLQIPQLPTDDNVKYLADQLKDLTSFVSHHTGTGLDGEKLKKIIENTNLAREYMQKAYELARHIPSPTSGRDLKDFGIVMSLLLGTEEAVSITKSYLDEYRGKISSGWNSDEKFRLMWIQNRIQFKNPIETMLRDEYGAVIVVDELNDIFWDPIDPEDPYTGLAKRAISIPFNGPAEYRINYLKGLAEKYRVHGAINPCNWGCRQGAGSRGLIEKGLKEIDIPVLNLEVDCIDSRNFSEGQLRTRIEAFIEMLGSRPSPWEAKCG